MSLVPANPNGLQRRPIRLVTQDDAVELYHRVWDDTVSGGDIIEPLMAVAEAFGYQFDPILKDVTDLSLGELQKIGRFAGNPNLADSRRGNTAQHVLQGTIVACYDLVDEFREFLFAPHISARRPWADYDAAEIDHIVGNVPNIIDSVFLEFLSHDDGEKLFEPASLTQAVSSNMRKSWPILERRIAYFGTALALYAHEHFEKRQDKKKFYADVLEKVRAPAREYYDRMAEEVMAGRIDPERYAEQVTGHIISHFIKPQEAKLRLSMVSTRYQQFMDRYLSRYDDPEGFGRAGGFTGIYTKIGQKNHSVMHIVEHQGLDGAAPHEHTTSLLTVASLGYGEGMLARLFNEVEGGDPIHRRMATRAARRVYETNLAMTRAMPAVIDITKKRGEESDANSFARLGEIQALAQEMCGEAGFTALHTHRARTSPGTLRTSLQLRARYQAALAEASDSPNFQPPARPFYELDYIGGAVGNRVEDIDLKSMKLYPGPDRTDLQGYFRRRWLEPVSPV